MLKVRNRTELSQVDLSPSFIISCPLSQFSFCQFTHWNILCTKIHNPNKTVKNRFWNGGKSLCFCRIPTALVERGQEFWHRFPAILLMSSILYQTEGIWFNSLYLRQFWFFLQRTLLNVFTICTICWEFIMNYSLHYRLRGSMGFEKYEKWTKIDTCFSFNKTYKTRHFAIFVIVMTQILH